MDIFTLLKTVAKQDNSDLHLVYNSPPMVRKDGQLKIFLGDTGNPWSTLSDTDLRQIVGDILSKEQRAKLDKEKDLDTALTVSEYRFRLNFSFDRSHLKVAARVIKDSKPTLKEIGMPETIETLLDVPQGLILVTGPTGCGKSTTLAAMINHINSNRACHVVTLEDPIEYLFSPDKSIISQRQLGKDMLSFAAGLKHVLRQDPNVIMLGEMRDLDTIATAVTLAETGHLVLATLHTYSAAQTIDRIIDIFPAHQQGQIRSQLSMVLVAVISQRLLPRLSGGRIAAREIMLRNGAISNLIRENKIPQIKTVLETNSQSGMITMDRHLKQLYQAKEISRETAVNSMEEASFIDS